jgi:CHRD domain
MRTNALYRTTRRLTRRERKGVEVSSRHGRKLQLFLAGAVALVVTGAALGASTAPLSLSSRLGVRQVVPHKPKGNVAHAAGTFAGSLRSTGSRWKLSWRLAYRGLDHPSIVIADIHYGKPGKFGPVIVRLCGPCKSGQGGVAKVRASWVPTIRIGNAFITLITGKNPNGEIRGQIKVS